MRKNPPIFDNESGFTIVEFVVILILVMILAIFFFSGCQSQIRQSFEREVKANVHSIQVAIVRYAVDHNRECPAYILGGDLRGWNTENGCETITKRPPFATNLKQTNNDGGGARPPMDPLIEGGYLESYPVNPFLKQVPINAPAMSGGVKGELGTGDVRFGYDGLIMGNVLDDPRFLWGRYPVFDQPDKIRLQPTRMVNTMSRSAWLRGYGVLHHKNTIQPFYSLGGIPNPDNTAQIKHWWWPGQFFYRATGPMRLRDDFPDDALDTIEQFTIWDFEIVKYETYFLGAYGDTSTTGKDLIRLTTLDGKTIQNRSGPTQDVYNRSQMADYPENIAVYMSPPEIFGGGEKGVAPVFPYYNDRGEFIYGAPDGYPDGILIAFTSTLD